MDDRYLELLELLLAKTKKKEANWVQKDESTYLLRLETSSVIMYSWGEIRICNISDVCIKELTIQEYPVVDELLIAVKAYILRVGETLASMLEELSKPGIVGANEKNSELPF